VCVLLKAKRLIARQTYIHARAPVPETISVTAIFNTASGVGTKHGLGGTVMQR
jgi:hypothetical protein